MEKQNIPQMPIVPTENQPKPEIKPSSSRKWLIIILFLVIVSAAGIYFLGKTSNNPVSKLIPSETPTNQASKQIPSVKINISNLPSTVRQQGTKSDIQTVRLIKTSLNPSGNFFSSILPYAYAQSAGEDRLIVYLVPNPETPGQYWIYNYSLLDGKSAQLIDKSFNGASFSLSPLGFLVFYTDAALYKFNLASRTLETIDLAEGCEKACTYNGPYPPSISPDGSSIAFFRGSNLIVRSLTDGKQASYNIPENTVRNDAVWSNDGRIIYVKTVRSVNGIGMNDIVEVNLSTSETRVAMAGDTAKHQISFFNADEKSQTLLYIGEEFGKETNRFLVKHNTITGSQEFRDVSDFLQAYVWSPDHQTLYFTQGGGVKALGLSTGKISTILASVTTPYVRLVGFGRNDQELIVSDGATTNGTRTISYYSYDLQTKTITELFQFKDAAAKGLW